MRPFDPATAIKGAGRKLPNTGGGGDASYDWTQPLVDPRSVPSEAVASSQAGFDVVAPAATGTPTSITVHASFRPQAVALVYKGSSYGSFSVLEEHAWTSQAALESLPQGCHPETGCEGSWSVVQIPSGPRALLIADPPNVVVIMWLHGPIQFTVTGPADSFSTTLALKVAAAFDAQATATA